MLTHKEQTQILAHIAKSPTSKLPRVLNSLLLSLSHSTTPHRVLHLYNHILRHHHPTAATHFTFTHALTACHRSTIFPYLLKGAEIHAHVIKSGHNADLFIHNSLINLYTSRADVKSAYSIFSEIANPDVVSWTSMVSGLVRNRCEKEAVLMFVSMDVVRPNAMTLVSVLSACASLKEVQLGRILHGYGLKIASGVILDNATLNMYMSCGDSGSARVLFDEMPQRDVVSWTTMVSGYARHGCCREAIRVFRSLVRCGEVMPNEATLAAVLRACASIGSLSFGKWVHGYMDENEAFAADGLVGNALVNMYAKCGDIETAYRVFDSLPFKDLVSWSTIIGGMAFAGRAGAAIEMFSSMLCHGINPDSVVFLSVLSACCHAGRVNDGRMFFEAMERVYGIVPKREHCTCMVDALGRAGQLEEAESLLRGMPVELDGQVLGALLNACKIHGDEKRRKLLETMIVEGEVVVEGGGVFALLSNSLASVGKWDCSIGVRELMRARRVKKAAGCSWTDCK